MKSNMLKVLFVSLFVSCSRTDQEISESDSSATTASKRLMISATCNVDTNLLSVVEEHVSLNTGVPFRRTDCLSLNAADFDTMARSAFNTLQPEDVYGLVLYDLPTNQVDVTIYTVQDRLALLNVDRLRRGTPLLSDDDARFERRVKKESMRALGTLITLPQCPTYTCAMYAHGNTNSLDRKGWNFCPPHRVKSDKLLQEAGLPVKTVFEQAMELHLKRAKPAE